MKSNRRILALLLCLLLVCMASSASAATKKPSKTFTEVPTLKYTESPEFGTASGNMNDVTISASIPGFLNLYITDEAGNIYLTLAKGMEIHSNETTIDFYAFDDSGELLAPGEYQFSADMVSQFGVPSATVTRKTMILESSDKEIAAMAAANKKVASAPSTSTESASSSILSSVSSAVSTADTSSDSSAVTTADTSTDSSAVTTADTSTDSSAVTIADSSTDTSTDSVSTSILSAISSSASNAATATPKPAATPVPETVTYASGNSKMGDEGLLIGVGVSDAAVQSDAGYWGLTADASDAELWAAITRELVGVDVDENESAYIYDSVESGRKKIGTVSGISHGLNVIAERDDGWALVEAFRNEDGAFVRGYIKSNKLRVAQPNTNYGIVIDKATQTLTIFKDGARVGSCKVTTGLATPKYPHRETPAGEFITVTRRGSLEYYGKGFTKYTIRINGGFYLAEIPTTKKNGSKFLEDVQSALGSKGTRGTICVAHDASTDGGINAKWIWDMTDENKRVKVLIFDDKARTDVPVSVK